MKIPTPEELEKFNHMNHSGTSTRRYLSGARDMAEAIRDALREMLANAYGYQRPTIEMALAMIDQALGTSETQTEKDEHEIPPRRD
jgi:hypothetical protein